eukprot:CAMPEP_0113669478 /NCGR_PEP_ID=MMETSP0038_2-20120614/4591_1 /TAXON_ID=2898 /ORGANISM="Cryptomonas paramecium" /LENGTH=188 /DNA_ID=CAMNT_0000585363 /DNA_START=58 /DNA_END=621 /DNA_ORIENTATION=- /assembly_acc=CAM_ASM_000170
MRTYLITSLTVALSLIASAALYYRARGDGSSALMEDPISAAWTQMTRQPDSGIAGEENTALDQEALARFRKAHKNLYNGQIIRAKALARRRRKYQAAYTEPALPLSATQGWSDLLSRVTREMASDTFDIEEMKVKMRNLEHQNGVLLAKYQAIMSMKDRRGPKGAQGPAGPAGRPGKRGPPGPEVMGP